MTGLRNISRCIPLLMAAVFSAGFAHNALAQVTLNFTHAGISEVAEAIGAATGKTIVVDPRVKGQLDLVSEHPVSEARALEVLQSALRMQGYALVSDHGVLKVVPEADAKLQGVSTYIGDHPRAVGDQVITQVFALHNASATKLLPVLRPLISPNNAIDAYAANNTIVVTDYADNVRRIAQIIAGVDGSSGSQVMAVPLRNADALDVASQINKLLDPNAIGNTDATLKVTATADPRTNTVLLRASSQARLSMAARLVRGLDAPTGAAGNMHVVPLMNADAVSLAKTLRSMFGAQSESSGAGSAGGSTKAGAALSASGVSASGSSSLSGLSGQSGMSSTSTSTSTSSISSDDPIGNGGGNSSDDDNQSGGMIEADAATNSLIITASEPTYRNLRAVIDQLDVRRAQVYIEALVVELNSNKGSNLGIQWQASGGAYYAGSSLGSGGATNSTVGGTGGNTITSLSEDVASGASSLESNISSGLNIGWLHNMFGVKGLGGLIQAFAGSNDANVLSTPNLITLDNQSAKIVVGENVPVATGSYSNLTSSSTSSAFDTYDRVDVGLTLHVKPHITDGGHIELQVYTEDSSVVSGTTDTSTNAAGPTFTKRSIQSTILADDGQIIVLGGLMQDNYQVSNNKVPLLGDLPLIGALFRSESKSREKTNLLVFLRPVIIHDGQTADKITQNRYDYVEGVQGAYKSDNHYIYDKDDPVVPPMPAGPRQGVAADANLFDLDKMRRTQAGLPESGAQSRLINVIPEEGDGGSQ